MDFHILINIFTTNPGYWHICVECILTRIASPPDRYQVKRYLMLANMANNKCKCKHYFTRYTLKLLLRFFEINRQWNVKEKSQLRYLSYNKSLLQCKATTTLIVRFYSLIWKLAILLLPFVLHWFVDNKYCTFRQEILFVWMCIQYK